MNCFFCRACDELWMPLSPMVSAQNDTDALALADPQHADLVAAADLREQRPAESFSRLVNMAIGGSVWSMLNVAIAYERGDGVVRNKYRAEYWYRRASSAGSLAARWRLVELLTIDRRLDDAEALLASAVAEGKPIALRLLALTRLDAASTPAKVEEARALLGRALALGDLGAGLILGRRMARGRFGLRRIPEGVRLFAAIFERLQPSGPTRAATQAGDTVPRLSHVRPSGEVR